MLIQNTHLKRLSFLITIAFLIIGFSVLSTMPAQASPNVEFIPPEGGEINAKNNSTLIVAEGALGDIPTALDSLDNGIALLEDLYAYIDGLSTVENDPSGEWMKAVPRNEARNKCNGSKNYSISAKQKRTDGNAQGAWSDANTALTKLNNLRTHVADKYAEGKAGVVAHDNIQAQCDLIEPELILAEANLGEKLKADSFKEVITLDDATILAELNNALSLVNSQYDYIAQLAEADDGSGEWVKPLPKTNTLGDCNVVRNKITAALNEHNGGNNQAAMNRTREGLDNLDVLDTHNDNRVANDKMGSLARDNIEAYSEQIRTALEVVESLHYETLTFEFGPHGTEFAVPAELIVPLDEIFINDDLFWYSGDGGEVIDLFEMGYFIDDVNGTINFYIEHFSEYYFPRP